jgi:hypothetical protein
MKGIYRYQLVDIDSIFSKNRCLYLWKAPADPEDHQEVTVYMPVTILNPSSTAWLWNCSIRQYHLLNTTEGLYNKQSSDNSTTFCVLINAPSVELHITKRKTGVQCWKQENKSTIFVCIGQALYCCFLHHLLYHYRCTAKMSKKQKQKKKKQKKTQSLLRPGIYKP